MSDSYQAIYDAVRSCISNGDIGSVVQRVAYEAFDWSHAKAIIQQEFCIAAGEMQRPSVLLRAQLECNGGNWTANYGPVYGFGESPDLAMKDFDQNFYRKKEPKNEQ